ncbi:MAG: hypothetical protein WBB13_19985 [Tabrizicola sp.]
MRFLNAFVTHRATGVSLRLDGACDEETGSHEEHPEAAGGAGPGLLG